MTDLLPNRITDAALELDPLMDVAPRQRVRLVYAKGEAVKFISHQDEFRMWERTLRRAGLPLLYKQGFNPQPHMQFASPLGVGFTGEAEPLDITLSPPVPLDELQQRIAAKLPPGVTLSSVQEVPRKTESLQGLLIGADYSILVYATPDELTAAELEQRIATFLSQTVIWRERERKGERYQYNLRPLVFELHYMGYSPEREEHRIALRVQQRAGATGRPDEVVAAMELDHYARTLRRDRLYFDDQSADAAIFAAYPVVTQASIAGPRPTQPHKRGGRGALPRTEKGRSISERAGDEFA